MDNIASKAKSLLIQERTREEERLADFAKSITSVNREEVFAGVYIPPVFTLEALCPEAYKENPDPEQYEIEFNRMCEIIDAINKRIEEYTTEAIECYKQYMNQVS